MGIQEELEAARKPAVQRPKLEEWLESLPEEDRRQYVAALKAPKEVFSHLALTKIANNNGCKIAESTLRRYREKLQENT